MTSSEIPEPLEDPFSKVKQEAQAQGEVPPRVVNAIHRRDDTDSKATAHHHTLGVQRNQASPGDHVHDGKASKKVGAGMNLSISGSRGGNAAVASIIAMLKNVMIFTDNTTA